MTAARFFDRVATAVGRHLSITRDALDSRLAATVVQLRCGDLSSLNDRWAAEMLVNLLARLYPTISIAAPDGVKAELEALARSIHPRISIPPAASTDTVVISVGCGAEPGLGAIHVGASGWVARVASVREFVEQPVGPANPFAAAAAASIGASRVFRRIFLDATAEPPVSVSLLDYSTASGADLELPAIDVGRLLVAGIGAVGSAAVWVLARVPALSGHLSVIDGETVELSNLQRYVLALDADVGAAKVELGARAFGQRAPEIERKSGRLGDGPAGEFDAILVATDNVDARRTAQALLPRLVLNGWTSDSGLGASWHDFAESRACLACLYHPTGVAPSQTDLIASSLGISAERAAQLFILGRRLDERDLAASAAKFGVPVESIRPWLGKPVADFYTSVVCGAAGLEISNAGHLDAVPLAHQSVLAGVLAATELVKRSVPQLAAISNQECLVAWHDVLRPPPTVWTQARDRVDGCICGDPIYRAVYASKWPQPS